MSTIENKSLATSILSHDLNNHSEIHHSNSDDVHQNNVLMDNHHNTLSGHHFEHDLINNDDIVSSMNENGLMQHYSSFLEPQPPRGLTASAFKRIQNYYIIAAGLEAAELTNRKGKLIQERLLECFYRLISNESVIREFPELGSSKILLRKTLKNDDTFDSNRLWHKFLDIKRHIIKEILPAWSKVVTLAATMDKSQDELLLATRIELWNVMKASLTYKTPKHNKLESELIDNNANDADEFTGREFSELWYPTGWLAFLKFGPVSDAPHPDFIVDMIDDDNISINTKVRITGYLNNSSKRYSHSNVTGTVINNFQISNLSSDRDNKRLRMDSDMNNSSNNIQPSIKIIPKHTNIEFERQRWEKEQEKWAKEFAMRDRQDKIARLEKSIKVCQELYNNPGPGQEGYDNLQKLREKYLKITSEGFDIIFD